MTRIRKHPAGLSQWVSSPLDGLCRVGRLPGPLQRLMGPGIVLPIPAADEGGATVRPRLGIRTGGYRRRHRGRPRHVDCMLGHRCPRTEATAAPLRAGQPPPGSGAARRAEELQLQHRPARRHRVPAQMAPGDAVLYGPSGDPLLGARRFRPRSPRQHLRLRSAWRPRSGAAAGAHPPRRAVRSSAGPS